MEKSLLHHLHKRKKKKKPLNTVHGEKKKILNRCEGNILVLGLAWKLKIKNKNKQTKKPICIPF